MNITRKNFIGCLTAALALPSIGLTATATRKNEDDWFEDLVVDRYYTIQGGPYKDTGGYGSPYNTLGAEMIMEFRYWERCRELEDKFEEIERRGFYLSQSQYFGKPYREYNKIPLTKRWLMEFYRRHKNDTPDVWQKRYDDYYNALSSSGWKVSDDYVGNDMA